MGSKEKRKNAAPGTERFPAYLYSIKFNASTGLPPRHIFYPTRNYVAKGLSIINLPVL